VQVQLVRIKHKHLFLLFQISRKIKHIMKDYIVSVIHLELIGVLFEIVLLNLFRLSEIGWNSIRSVPFEFEFKC
jgi:hypothetical protein